MDNTTTLDSRQPTLFCELRQQSEDALDTVTADGLPATTTTTGRTTKCFIHSGQQVPQVLLAAATLKAPDYTCPVCQQTFPCKKTLFRHVKAVIQRFQGSLFQCQICGLRCSRKDILTRHEKTRHGKGSGLVRCNVCGQEVKRRSLTEHHKSQACIRAGTRTVITESQGEIVQQGREDNRGYEPFLALSRSLHAVLDCVLLSAWLFAKLQPWGRRQESTDLWMARIRAPRSYEVDKLKGRLFNSLREALSSPGAAYNPGLFDAVVILIFCTTWTEGWYDSHPHQTAALYLAQRQIRASSLSREAFVAMANSQAVAGVLHHAAHITERTKCEEAVRKSIAVMRGAGYDYVSNLSNGFRGVASIHAIDDHSQHLTADMFHSVYTPDLIPIIELVASIGSPVPAAA